MIRALTFTTGLFCPYFGTLAWQTQTVQEYATDVAKAAPALAILAFVVWRFTKVMEAKDDAFLKALREESQQRDKAETRREETLKTIGDACHATQDRATESMENTARVLGRVEGQLEANTQLIDRLNTKLDRER